MKKFSILLILSVFLFQLQAQQQSNLSFKPERWEIGWLANDLLIGRLTADIVLSFSDKHAFGLRSSIGNDFLNTSFGGLYDGSNFVYRGGLFHKMYFPHSRNKHFTVRHGPRFRYSEDYFEKEEWVSFQNLGNRQYVLRDVEKTDNNLKLGYEILFGLQGRYESSFFYEYYVGIKYMQLVNTSSDDYSLNEISESSVLSEYFQFTSNRVDFVIGFVIGLQWDN
jgi:hypothetical protein